MSNKVTFHKENGCLVYIDAKDNVKISVNIKEFKFKVENPTTKRKLWVYPRHAAIAYQMLATIEEQLAKAKENNETTKN